MTSIHNPFSTVASAPRPPSTLSMLEKVSSSSDAIFCSLMAMKQRLTPESGNAGMRTSPAAINKNVMAVNIAPSYDRSYL